MIRARDRHPRRCRRREDDGRILPLINIVFLLLIFFMLSGRFTAGDPFQLRPPVSANATATAGHELLVLVAADGRLGLNGEVTEAAALRSEVTRRLSSERAPRVHLMADGRAEARRIAAVMELLRESGVERLRLLTLSTRH